MRDRVRWAKAIVMVPAMCQSGLQCSRDVGAKLRVSSRTMMCVKPIPKERAERARRLLSGLMGRVG